MTRKLLGVINLQSVSDIITNSSSEVFVVRNKGSVLTEIQQTIIRVIEAAYPDKDWEDMLWFQVANGDGKVEGWNSISYKKGNLLIWSTDENTIPYWLMEFIEQLDHSRVDRYHLG